MDKEKEIHNIDEYVKLSAFADIEIGVTAAKTINEAMDQVMKKIGEIFSPVTYALLLKDEDKDVIYFKLVNGKSTDKLMGLSLPKAEGLSSWVIKEGKADVILDVAKDNRFSKTLEKNIDFTAESMIGAPLVVTDKIIGVFQLINKENNQAYTPADLNILKTIVEYASMAIEKVYYLSALKDMDNVDSLTGIFKRKNFDTQLKKEAERCNRYDHALSLVLITIDDFKMLNEKFGHQKCDQILKDLAQCLKRNVRRVDIVARYGVNELAVLMPNTDRKNAESVRQRILDDIERINQKRKPSFEVSTGLSSVGAKESGTLLEKTEKDLEKELQKKGIDSREKEETPEKKKKDARGKK
ncbi:MAG: sensor domain-containing diguanylate cyclase [Candidatus Aminicenantes bacterium]|jgi:diguanylate cyclase (GGDEF)-like protein